MYVREISSLDVAPVGEIWTSDATGGVLVSTTVSVIVSDDVDQASPLFPFRPFAVKPAMLTVTVPLPAEGAIQSNVHERLPLFECVMDVPLTLTDELPPVDKEPLSTSTLKPPLELEMLLETESWIV